MEFRPLTLRARYSGTPPSLTPSTAGLSFPAERPSSRRRLPVEAGAPPAATSATDDVDARTRAAAALRVGSDSDVMAMEGHHAVPEAVAPPRD